jgi:hypothetical protein
MLVESLESRELLAAGVAVTVEPSLDSADALFVSGTRQADTIHIRRDGRKLIVNDGQRDRVFRGPFSSISIEGRAGADRIRLARNVDVPAVLHGGGGCDTLAGGRGDDSLYGQAGRDVLIGRLGDDTLVAVGGTAGDRLVGGDGLDSFWLDDALTETLADASADELDAAAVHRISAFASYAAWDGHDWTTASTDTLLLGQNLADPLMDASYSTANVAKLPLFGRSGPLADDIEQGWRGDCYFLAVLASAASHDPNLIRQSVASLGDGTYAVRFHTAGQEHFVRVDGDLPAISRDDGAGLPWLANAGLGHDGSTWVAIMEKAWACFRTGYASYADIDGGWMSEVYDALDLSWADLPIDDTAAALDRIAAELADGNSVTLGTLWGAEWHSPLVGAHAYTIIAVTEDAAGGKTLVLRNPWAIDGYGSLDGCDDGYVQVSPAQFASWTWRVQVADI